MKRILSARGRVAVSVLVMALLASLSAFYYFNAVPVRSWHMPEVSIVTPADGEDVAGPVVITATYSVSNGHVHTMRTLIDGQVADSKPAESQSGTYTFTWNSATLSDGPHTIEVRAYTAAPPSHHFNKETITINVSNALCRSDADCDDQDDHTQDTCANAGTPSAACVHAPIACLNDAECSDSDPLTLDSCQNAGTSESLCVNTAIQCNNNTDCNDSDTHTEDLCMNGGTASAACQYNPIACLNDAECNDSNALTLDSCQSPGMASSACVNAPIDCNTHADCDDGDEMTADSCSNPGTADAFCENMPVKPACRNDGQCDDGDPMTLDECRNPGGASAFCVNTPVACNANSDCDDADPLTQDSCLNAGAAGASCAHDPLACNSSTDCDDGNAHTIDKCGNPGTTASTCTHAAIACLTNQDCDDSNALTLDSCQNPGTANASCENTPIACNTNMDCDDGDDGTNDQCTNGGTVNAACSHVPGAVEPEPEDLNLEVMSPDDWLVSNQTTITVTGVATPGAALTINGNSVSINGAGAFSSAMTLSEGANTLTIKCCLGGECLTETRAVTVDTQAPEILDATVEEGNLYIGVRDNAGGTGLDVSFLEVTIDGDTVSATYDATRKALRIIPGDLTPGAHIAVVSVSDLAGNTEQRTVNVVFRPNAGLKIIFKKLPGRQVPDEGTESSAFIAPPSDQTVVTGLISGEPGSVTSQSLESATGIASASPSAWDFSTLAAPGDYTVEARKFLDLFDGKIDRAPGAKLPPGLLKKLDCSKAPDGNPLTLEAAATYSGDIEAQVTVEQGIQIDEQSIQVKVDGAPVPYQYDESTQSIKATSDELTRGVHTVEVSAADTDGNTTVATTAFGVDPNVLQFTLENVDNPGGTITVGQRFKVTLELDDDPGGTPWFMLFNANYMSDPAPHLIGWIYEMNTVSQATGSYLYDYTGWFYTSFDQSEEEASVIGAAIPLDAGATQFTTAAGTIQVENGYARPIINSIELSKYNSPDRSLQVGDSYVVQASGTQGIQKMFSVLLNIDTFIQASNPLDAAVLKNGYVPGDPMTLVDPMVEDPAYGSGHYIVVNHAVPLESSLDVQGSPVRAIMSMVCSPTSGNVCDVGNVMYLGSAPVMNSVTLMNLSGSDPNAPFSNTARGFRVEVQGNIAPEHLANTYLVLANAAKVTAGIPLKKTPGQPLLDWTITNGFAEVSGQPGMYAAEGVIDGYIDDDGTLASEVVAIVSAAGFYDDSKSAPHAIEQQQPPVPAPDPTTIETIAGQTVGANNHVTSDQDTPVITGSAPENSLVTIYELDPEGSNGALTSAFAPSGEFVNGVGFFGDPMDDGQWEDRWNGYIDSYGTFSFSETDWLLIQAGPGSKARLFSIASSAPFGDGFTMSAQMEFPSGLNSAPQDMDVNLEYAGLINTPDRNTYALGFRVNTIPGTGVLEMRVLDDRGHSCESADHPLVAHDTPYAVDMIYDSAGLLTLRINGTDVIAACPVQPAPVGAKLQPGLTLNAGNAQSAITWRGLTTDIPMPDGYMITAPALSIDNGPVYDAFGNGSGGFFTNDGQVIFTDGSSMIAGIDGTKDIYAALVTLYDLLYDPQQPPLPQAALTLYTAGSLETANGDQLNAVHDFLESLFAMGAISGYAVDAVGVALSAQPGGGFAPGPMRAQSMVCAYEPGVPASLTWDSAQSIYIGSHSALEYQGQAYDAFVAWGQSQTSDAPNIIGPEGGPVWWADGSADITAGALCSTTESWCATGYGTQELFDQLQGNVDPELHALAHGVLRAPAAPGEDYTLDPAALESAGLTPAKRLTCAGYGHTPIATATADNSGSYQATKDAPFAATGDHLLYAESADPATGRPISNSSIVTYSLQGAGIPDTTPPVISFSSHSNGQIIASNQPVVAITVTDPESGVDWNGLICSAAPSNITCTVTHTSGDSAELLFSAPLPDGLNTLTVMAQDLAATPNSAAASITLEIDASAPVIVNLSAAPSPFSPANSTSDGTKDSTTITASVSDAHPDGWYLYILNPDGNSVRYLSGGGPDVSLIWNGTDDSSAPLPDGVYTVLTGALDTLGHSAEATAPVILDNASPDVTIQYPSPGAWLGPAPYTMGVQAADANGIERVEILLDGVIIGNAVPAGNGVYEFPLDFTGMKNSDHEIAARAFDNAGNNALATASVHIFNKPITVESVTLANLTRPGAPDIGVGERFRAEIRVSNANGAPAWRLVNSGRWPGADTDVAFTLESSGQQGKRHNYEGVLTACADAGGNTAPGVRIAASGDGFNTVELSGILTIPACAPAPPQPPVVTRPQNGATLKDSTPEVRGTAQEGVKVTIYLGDPGAAQPDTLIAIVDSVPANGRFATETLDLGASGQKTLYAVAEKLVLGALLQSGPSMPVTFTLLDTEKPVITSIQADPNPFSPGDPGDGAKDITYITAMVLDDNPAGWEMRVFTTNPDGSANQRIFTTMGVLPAPDPVTGLSSAVAQWDGFRVRNNGARTLQLDGLYLIRIRATDASNKRSDWAEILVRIDRAAPVVSISAPAAGAAIGGIQVPMTLTATDMLDGAPHPELVQTIRISVHNALGDPVWTTAAWRPDPDNAPDQWRAILAPHAMGDGPATIRATAVDAAGNSGAPAEISGTVDTVAPGPPTDVTLIDNGDGTATLFWVPPTTNEDGSALTDLAGYNIYRVTQTPGCEPVEAADSTPIACGPGAVPGSYTINGPALIHNNIAYTGNPLTGGSGAVWLDADAALAAAPWLKAVTAPGGAGTAGPFPSQALPANALKPMPLTDSASLSSSIPVFSYVLSTSLTPASGLQAGQSNVSVYTQLTHSELTAWLDALAYTAAADASATLVAAHAPICHSANNALLPAGLPIDTIPAWVPEPVESRIFVSPQENIATIDMLTAAMAAIISADSAGNASMSTEVRGQ